MGRVRLAAWGGGMTDWQEEAPPPRNIGWRILKWLGLGVLGFIGLFWVLSTGKGLEPLAYIAIAALGIYWVDGIEKEARKAHFEALGLKRRVKYLEDEVNRLRFENRR